MKARRITKRQVCKAYGVPPELVVVGHCAHEFAKAVDREIMGAQGKRKRRARK